MTSSSPVDLVSLEHEVVLEDVLSPTYDGETDSLILLKSSAPLKQINPDSQPVITEGHLISFSLKDRKETIIFPEKIESNGVGIYDIQWSPQLNMAIIQAGRKFYLLDLLKKQILPFPPNTLWRPRWYGEKILTWEETPNDGEQLRVILPENLPKSGQGKELAYFSVKGYEELPNLIIGDQLLLKLRTEKWISINLQSGKQKEIEGLPEQLYGGGHSIFYPPIFSGPDDQSFLLQNQMPGGTFRIFFWRWGQPPKLILSNQPMAGLLWLDTCSFIFSYRHVDRQCETYWTEIGYCDLKDSEAQVRMIGKLREDLGDAYPVHYDKSRSDLWCWTGYDLVRVHLPLKLPSKQDLISSNWWLYSLLGFLALVFVGGFFFFLREKRR